MIKTNNSSYVNKPLEKVKFVKLNVLKNNIFNTDIPYMLTLIIAQYILA